MRLRLESFILLCVIVFAIALRPALAADRSGPAKSTIRIVTESAPPAAPAAAPTRIVLPSQPAEPTLVSQDQPQQADSIQASYVPPTDTAELYPVRQAIHAAPLTPTAQAIASLSATTAPKPAPPVARMPTSVNVYSNPNAQAMLSRMPRRMAFQPQPKASKTPRGKPFQSIPMEPAVSPYLNMYRRDVDGGNLPNYFAFVLPQLEQQQASRQQTAELQKLRDQVQNLGASGGAPSSASMSAHARYMDTAQYYSGMKR